MKRTAGVSESQRNGVIVYSNGDAGYAGDRIIIDLSDDRRMITSVGAQVQNVALTPEGFKTLRTDLGEFVNGIFERANPRLVEDPQLMRLLKDDAAFWGPVGFVALDFYAKQGGSAYALELSDENLRAACRQWGSAVVRVQTEFVPITATRQKVEGPAHHLLRILQTHKAW